MSKIEEFRQPERVVFVGEQDGHIERDLKSMLSRLFSQSAGIGRAYLARVRYGDSTSPSVALCLAADTDVDRLAIAKTVSDAFAGLFHESQFLDILDRDTIVNKWNRLIGLVGFPARLISPPWHFDHQMLQGFDDVRHNAVHHEARAVKAFDLNAFAEQLWRAQWVLVAAIASVLNVKIPAETIFGNN
jgi:hypothetical protein